MKGVDTIARIRREFFVRGKSIKQIVRELHVSRNTVRKVLRSGETEFSYERDVQPLPRLGRFQAELDRLLARISQSAPTARTTSGGRIHPDSGRFDLVADRRCCWVTGGIEAL